MSCADPQPRDGPGRLLNRSQSHEARQLARDLKAALPEGWDALEAELPQSERHRWYLSGKSSQVLALGLLGPAKHLDPMLGWLWSSVGLPVPSWPPDAGFERRLEPTLLGERPRVTAVDFCVETPEAVVCVEAKWAEAGIGRCNCRAEGGAPLTSACAKRVLCRSAYWTTAREVFGLPERVPGSPCPLSFGYQAVRNAAAARALAGPTRRAVFVLLYDADNPYFCGAGAWPGWATVLKETLAASDLLTFSALSWQQLTPRLPYDDAVAEWATEKHGLRWPAK